MNNHQKIQNAYKSASNYPDLALKLSQIGVKSYTVDTVTGTILYRFDDGENLLHPASHVRTIAQIFDEKKTISAIRNNQEGKSDYSEFMSEIAKAGVRFYEATLSGQNRRVTYIGTGGFYEEAIF